MSRSLSLSLSAQATDLSADSGSPRATDDQNSELAREDLSAGAFEVVRGGSADRLLSAIGRFDLGLDERSARDGATVTAAVQRFVARHSETFGVGGVRLRLLGLQPITDTIQVATFEQVVGNLPVSDSEVTVAFFNDGTMQSINGRLVDAATPFERPVGVDAAAEVFQAEGLIHGPATLLFDGEQWQSPDGSLEEVYSDLMGAAAWLLRTQNGEFILDQETGTVELVGTPIDSVTGPCNVRRRDFPRVAGRATTLNESTTTTITEEITCEASDLLGTCYWQLRKEPFGTPHGIARIEDLNGSEQEVALACSSQTVPSFTLTGGDGLREQGAYYVANQMRYFMVQNVWNSVAPNRDSNVKITVDNTGVTTAVFNDFTTDIDCNTSSSFGNACAQDVLSHEYGHYVVWTYDDVSDQCVAGQDEGDSIDETLANAFGLLFWLDDNETIPRYGTMSGFAFNNGPAAHTSAANILNAAPSCPGPNSPTDGQPFLQAVWELMWNRNCSTTDAGACFATSNAFGATIWTGGTTQETVITRVGAAMGFALSVLGTNITHQQIRAQMRSKIMQDQDLATANRAQLVFTHHGLPCPTCCAGC